MTCMRELQSDFSACPIRAFNVETSIGLSGFVAQIIHNQLISLEIMKIASKLFYNRINELQIYATKPDCRISDREASFAHHFGNVAVRKLIAQLPA